VSDPDLRACLVSLLVFDYQQPNTSICYLVIITRGS
jgi:hypothetical protein